MRVCRRSIPDSRHAACSPGPFPIRVESETVAARLARVAEALGRLRQAPDIQGAAAAAVRPLASLSSFSTEMHVTAPDGPTAVPVYFNVVTRTFASTIGARPVDGGTFEQLGGATRSVLVINERLARELATHGVHPPARVELPGFLLSADIVGVIADQPEPGGMAVPRPTVYLLQEDHDSYWLRSGLVRASNPVLAAPLIRRVVEETWGAGTPVTIVDIADELRRSQAPWRGRFALLAVVAVLCVPISVLGLAGAFARDVSGQRYETAVRLCLGASPARVRWLAIGGTVKAVTAGIVLGLALGWMAGSALASSLYQIAPVDPVVSLTVGGLLAGCTGLLAFRSAVGAFRIDPYATLRS
jgi:hypothetical protein